MPLPPEFDAVFDSWRRRVEAGEQGIAILELYEAAAAQRGVPSHKLPLEDRQAIWRRALPVTWPGYEVTQDSERNDRGYIRLVDYDPAWPERFETWRRNIAGALGSVARRVDHVGSTSVPGLAAKPIVDINVAVADLEAEDLYRPGLESIGVQLRSRDDQHRYFRPFAERPRDVHVHVCELGSAFERRHLLFVDFLGRSPDARRRYVEAKRLAVEHWHDDGVAYTEAKTACISPLMSEAERWAAQTGWSPG